MGKTTHRSLNGQFILTCIVSAAVVLFDSLSSSTSSIFFEGVSVFEEEGKKDVASFDSKGNEEGGGCGDYCGDGFAVPR